MSCEAARSLEEASTTIQKSKAARQAAIAAVEQSHHQQQLAHDSVNEGLTRKLAQTVTLTVSRAPAKPVLTACEGCMLFQDITRFFLIFV